MHSDHSEQEALLQLAAERHAQLEGAKVVLRPLTLIIAISAFAICYWRYDFGLFLSLLAALLVIPIVGLGAGWLYSRQTRGATG